MSSTSIALSIFLLYWALVSALDRKGILKKYNISTYGPLPILMIRTTKGLSLLDILARPKRYWRFFANLGILLMFVGMAAMFLIVAISDLAMFTSFLNHSVPEPSKYNAPRNILLIPGINEFIPFTWGVIALIVTLVVHEFSHAILCRVEDVRVKSMGILLALVPVGGFAEPDEEQLFGSKEEEKPKEKLTATIEEIEELERQEKLKQAEEALTGPKKPVKVATRSQRARILAAGVMSNFCVAFVAFLLFFGPVLGGIAPVTDVGVRVLSVNESSPAAHAGITENMVITRIDNTDINSAKDLVLYMNTASPKNVIQVQAVKDGVTSVYNVKPTEKSKLVEQLNTGVNITEVVKDSPAEAAGLKKGMTLIRLNNTKISDVEDFVVFMTKSRANQTVQAELLLPAGYTGKLSKNGTAIFNITLAPYPEASAQPASDKGYLGIYYPSGGIKCKVLDMTIGEFPAKVYLDLLKSIPSMLNGPAGWFIIFGLPIVGLAGEGGFRGFSGAIAQFYQPTGWAEPLGIGIFWLANALLWIGWLNFYVGLFNCLPAVPLDGGHVFRDYTYSLLYRLTGSEERASWVSNAIAASFSFLILFSFIFMIIGPFIGQLFKPM